MLLDIVLLVVGFVMLIKGADWFVEGTAGIASKFGIPQLVIGLTIVAMGTSAPEAAVSISAVMKGNAAITIGNVVGSNILNILIILGVTSVITTIAIQKSTLKVEMPYMIFITLVLLLMGYLNEDVNRIEGAILLVLFVVYLSYLFVLAKKGTEEDKEEERPIWKLLLFAVIGLAIIIFGSDLTVDGATNIAKAVGVSDRVIGLTIVALGTSLPELVTSVTAAKKGNADIAIGNIVGSNIFNILFVVGLSAVIHPVAFAANFLIDTIVAVVAGVVLMISVARTMSLKRPWGVFMLILYAGYLVYLLAF